MFRLLAHVICLGSIVMTAPPALAEKLGPSDKVAALRAQLDQRYTFIVRFHGEARVKASEHSFAPGQPGIVWLDSIGGLAAKIQVSRAFELAAKPEVSQVWYLHPELAPFYVRVILALEYNVRTLPLPTVANLSIGPQPKFWTATPDPNEPMHAATRAAAEAGLIPVIAIGNNPRAARMPGWINPWCLPEWVICVGAYDGAAGRVADFSARGAPEWPETWPDVVAQGVDVIGPYPTNQAKSTERKQRDESNPAFRELPREKWDIYTLESGTSQAAAHVTRASTQIVHFLREMIARTPPQAGRPLFSMTAPPERAASVAASRRRYTGTAEPQQDGSIVYKYTLDVPWKMTKQLLIDAALPIEQCKSHDVGAGLVVPEYVLEQFGEFGLPDVKIAPSRVVE